MKIKPTPYAPIIATVLNLILAYVVYMLCRIVYVWENWSLFASGWDSLNLGNLIRGGFLFDSSAIFYTNSLYAVLMLLPILGKERKWWHTMTKCLYVTVNSLAVVANLCDAVYSQFTGRRTTNTFFHEFSNEGNLGNIFFIECLNHWYLVLAGIALIAGLWILYVKPNFGNRPIKPTPPRHYYLPQSIALFLLIPISFCAIRGGVPVKVLRPVNLGTANRYVNQPHEAAIVLNTPYTVIRTIGKTTYADPKYMDRTTMEDLYTPLHTPTDTANAPCKGKNVVVIILESFGQEYVGFYNKELENGTYKGYTTFIDSLLEHSITWEHIYANGRKSIDAMPAILSSIPMFVEPFFTTSYSLNRISGLAAELSKEGYSSAFFHGADNGSMGFQSFAQSTGFQHYYGRIEYDQDPRFGGEQDYDNTWAIWDEPFLQYYATKMSEMPEPFITSVFTASSHHPFVIPEKYKDIYPEEEMVMHKCIRYTDNALRQFFATASQQPWFKNTIFVITNDHTNMSNHDLYRTAMGVYRGTLFIYDPSGELTPGIYPGTAQQIDIMPTVLGLLGYSRPYVAFGNDLLNIDPDKTWTVNYNNGVYQFLSCDTLVQFDGERVINTYNLKSDPMMRNPIGSPSPTHDSMLKAIIQQYMTRMVEDRLVAD